MRAILRRCRSVLARTPARRLAVWYRHRAVRPRDVIIGSYPRSGSTWLRFMLSGLIASEQDLTFDVVNRTIPDLGRGIPPAYAAEGGARRAWKTHEPWYPEYHTGVYLMRDPRDVAVSEFHYRRKVDPAATHDLDLFLAAFVAGRVTPYGSWGGHVTSWLDAADRHDRLAVLRYEDLLERPADGLLRAARAIGLQVAMDTVDQAVAANDAARMRAAEARSRAVVPHSARADVPFVRAARGGQWAETLTADGTRRIQEAFGAVMERAGYRLAEVAR